MERLLTGLKILDLTRVLAGPYATMVLADLGAEVIKVELPNSGDESRGFGPFQNGESAYFSSVNRGKKSITVDLRTKKGSEIVRLLLDQCDVLVENFRPGSMARFGLDYENLSRSHPHLVYVSISGFGQTGPYADRPAYDVIIQAMSGISSITGNQGEGPVRVGSSVADLSAALFGAIGILAAWGRSKATGIGQHVDISMLDCQIALLENAISRYYVDREIPGPLGSRHPAITPFQFFQASDGYLVIAVGNDGLWERFCSCIGHSELIEDSRYKNNEARTKNHADLESKLTKVFAQANVDYWLHSLTKAGVPCGPIQNIAQLCADPQVLEREMIIEMEHPIAGSQRMPNSPFKFSVTPMELNVPAPTLGQHTDQVLQTWLGIRDAEIKQMRSEGII